MKTILYTLSFLCFFACKDDQSPSQKIIQEAVEKHGGKHYDNLDISFNFRSYSFHIQNIDNHYLYTRTTQDSLGNSISDVLKDGLFERKINDKKESLSTKEIDKYKEGTNSVAYFVLLPYKLLDPAVNSQLIGTAKIDGKTYNKIKVWFDKAGGGKDHDDVFTYWFNTETKMLDYLAYDNGGPRFRKATQRDTIKGVVLQNYENFEITEKGINTWEYDKAFQEGKAKLLSKIEQSNYK